VGVVGLVIMKNKIDWRIVIVGLICLTAIEIAAMLNGINGTVRTIVIAAIAAAIGVTIPLDKFIKSK